MPVVRPKSGRSTARPPSGHLTAKSSSRMVTGTMQPPKTGQSINVFDRPITQQGVTGLRTATARGQQFRQILDKRYYEGTVRMKMKDIATEMSRLIDEIELQEQQQATFQVYEKRVREVALELTDLQGQLADYNVVIDKINTNTDKAHILAEAEKLKCENERRAADLDNLFTQGRIKEEQISALEAEIQTEKNETANLIQEMTDSNRSKYQEFKILNEQMQKEIEDYQQQLDLLTTKKIECEDKIIGSQMKQETVRLYLKLRERQQRKIALQEEERTKSTPAQEREQLLQKVKEDNAEITAIDRQISQVNEQIKKRKEELELIEQDLEESQADRLEKFKELKKREETMEQFLSTFNESKKSESEKIEELERKIPVALQRLTRNLLEGTQLPSQQEFFLIKENLLFKQEELDKSKVTVDELNKKREQLLMNLKKVEDLEKKIEDEISSIRGKNVKMNEELQTYLDVETVREKGKEKREHLMREKAELIARKDCLSEMKRDLEKENDVLMKDLNDNETYIQLNNLEKKLKVLQENNRSIKDFIESRQMEMEYEPLKRKVIELVNEYNQLLMACQNVQ